MDVPKLHLMWTDERGEHGVHTYEGALTWYSASETAPVILRQAFEDFVEEGPAVPCPEDVEDELWLALVPDDEEPEA